MPRKTKKQKQLAQQHLQSKLVYEIKLPPPLQNKQETLALQSNLFSTKTEDTRTRQYFMTDFKKSLILIVGIIALEIFFYFVSMRSDWLKAIYFFK